MKIELQAFGQEKRWEDQPMGDLTRSAAEYTIVPQV